MLRPVCHIAKLSPATVFHIFIKLISTHRWCFFDKHLQLAQYPFRRLSSNQVYKRWQFLHLTQYISYSITDLLDCHGSCFPVAPSNTSLVNSQQEADSQDNNVAFPPPNIHHSEGHCSCSSTSSICQSYRVSKMLPESCRYNQCRSHAARSSTCALPMPFLINHFFSYIPEENCTFLFSFF